MSDSTGNYKNSSPKYYEESGMTFYSMLHRKRKGLKGSFKNSEHNSKDFTL